MHVFAGVQEDLSTAHTTVWSLLKVNAGLVDTTPEDITCSAGTAPDGMSLNASMSGHQPMPHHEQACAGGDLPVDHC